MEDRLVDKGRRKKLIQYLRETTIASNHVLSAMEKIPRHLFLDSVFADLAYQDRAFSIASGQTISHPSTVAEQTELLNLQANDMVLEIGTGSGYQTAVLVAMNVQVYTIERQIELIQFAKNLLRTIDFSPRFATHGDGFAGLPTFAPYDKILVTCGAETLPILLLDQLKINGKLVIPLGKGEEQILTRFHKISANEIAKEEFGVYKFVPMLPHLKK